MLSNHQHAIAQGNPAATAYSIYQQYLCPFSLDHGIVMIDVARRLRRAVLRNDLTLVQRIVRNEPDALQNPDFDDKGNTSLHLACKEGLYEIAVFLVESGHEENGICKNADWDTPLMLAATHKHEAIGKFLIKRFPRCVPWVNKAGMDALMLSSLHGATPLIPPLLSLPAPYTASPFLTDTSGNTALHHASASGELLAVRYLLQAGSNPLALNAYQWTPIAYSATVAAEMYFKGIVQEMEMRRERGEGVDGREARAEGRRRMAGGVRLVTSEDVVGGRGGDESDETMSARPVGRGSDWSPVAQRRAMTPTVGREERERAVMDDNWPLVGNGSRGRASSGE